MRTLKYNNGVIRLQSRLKTGIVYSVTVNGNTFDEVFYWSSWRRFKKYIKS